MGFGVSGIVKSFTKKALIRYLKPEMGMSISDWEEQNQGTFGAITQSALSGLGTMLGVVQEIKPDVRKAETARLQSEVTEYAVEDGSVIAQHIIQRPLEVALYFEETNAGKMWTNILNTIRPSNQQSLYSQLNEIWKNKLEVEIITDQDIYKNMVLTSAPITQKSPYKNALQISCTFKQITKAKLNWISYKGATASLQKAASKKIDGGRQTTSEVTQ